MSSTHHAERRIYVACLASYNSGILHGEWIDTEGKDADDIQDEVNAMLRASPCPNVVVTCPHCDGDREICDPATSEMRASPTCKGTGQVPSAEEWAIHDHEGFGGLLGEYDSFERVAQLDAALEEHGEAFLAFLSAFGSDADIDRFGDAYRGEYDSERAFAEEWAIEGGLIDAGHPMFSYIDWDHYWSGDLQHSFVFEDGHMFDRNW
ncbi:antirestriction protein [Paraburkholderia sp. GAS448]|uniref:antirestriction protein ArdA n=1 Tax=Paraburkholderia sp. GAS448 TaxID=3035136 RepID=UPI003D214A95